MCKTTGDEHARHCKRNKQKIYGEQVNRVARGSNQPSYQMLYLTTHLCHEAAKTCFINVSMRAANLHVSF